MINQFKNFSTLNLILLLAYTFFMRVAFFHHVQTQSNLALLEPFARFIVLFEPIQHLSPLANIFFAAIITFGQALIFNRVVNNHNLLGKLTFLPALLYITTASLFMPFMLLSPALIGNFLLIWLIDLFLKLGKQGNAITAVFDIGMIIGLGTLIYFPFMAFILIIFIGLLLFRPFSWRDWVAGLVGFLTVFFFLAVFYYWNDNLSAFYQIWSPLGNKFPSIAKINLNNYLVLIPVLVILVLASLQLRENFFRSFISTRKAFQLLFFMFVVACASFYLKPQLNIWHFLLAVPPGAVLLAYYFCNAKIRWFYETLFLLFVLSIQCFLFNLF